MVTKEQAKSKKPAKVYVKYSDGEYENNPFCGSAYCAQVECMTKENSGEYLAKNAIIQALLDLHQKATAPIRRADANGFSKKMAGERAKILNGIIEQIAKM